MCAAPVSPQIRVPPHDLDAETSVLGAILLDPAAITRVLDKLNAEDFYRENNAQIYRAAQSLFREGEPIDNITLASELAKMGVLERIGGRAHLALLQESVPTAANVEHYARIVKDKAYKRRLITAGSQVSALGYDESRDAEEAVNEAQATVYAISDDKVGTGMEHIYGLLKPAMDRIDAQMASGGGVLGIPSGFHDLDRMTNGFKAADLAIIAGRPSMGKALALDTPIPTPNGWTTMGALRVGDRVFDEQGRACSVIFATAVMLGHDCYEVVFSDGETILADGDHQWSVWDHAAEAVLIGAGGVERGPTPRLLTTREMAGSPGGQRYSIPFCGALRYEPRFLPLDPYLLGAELGEGHIERLPRAYLEAGISQRLALLRGLMDVHGTEVCTPWRQLADGLRELAVGLGFGVRITVEPAVIEGADCGPIHRLRFDQPEPGQERGCRHVRAIRPAPPAPVRCIQVDAPNRLYLAGRGCVPTHNTSFVLNVTLHAAVEQKMPVAIFSLEMSKEQLVERMLCEQARIDAQRLHRGTLSDVEYERLAGALGPLGDAPIFIDDSPTLDDLTLRLKARQARSREGIELIVLDYLQLMHGRSRDGDANRVQEVSAISRALKGIARELSIPVIAISQLSRAPEARPDKRPILSDLRESGCLTADTRLLRADTGVPVSIGELLERGCDGVWVWSVDQQRRLQPAPLTRVFPSGLKAVFRLRLGTGREVKASGNHRFLTHVGWRALDDLRVGDRIALPRHIPAAVRTVPWNRSRLALLAHLISDGCTLHRQPLHYTSADEENLEVVEEAARTEFGVTPRRVRQSNWWHTYLPSPHRLTHGRRNPIAEWLDGLGVFGLRSNERRVPDAVFGASDADVAWFLRHLWATDGCVARNGVPGLHYATSSPRLAEDVAHLLLRFGIVTKTHRNLEAGSTRPTSQIWIRGVDQIRRFACEIGIHGPRGRALDELVIRIAKIQVNTNWDTVPLAVWADVRSEMLRTGTAARALAAGMGMAYCGSTLYGSAPSRTRLASVIATIGGSPLLEEFATDDVFWDRIVAIEPLGEQAVYDGTVAGNHNFIADGVIAHNSIEQDADIVMFLYRDDYYNREKSEKPGIAEVIVAKHRNGPTGVVELIFRKELTRFENMERRRPEMGSD